MNDIDTTREILDDFVGGIDQRQPRRIASLFTEDGIFQGSGPYSVGRSGVAAYYESQPLGLTASYRLLETRRLAEDVILGYLAMTFGFNDRGPLEVNFTVVIRREGDDWRFVYVSSSRT